MKLLAIGLALWGFGFQTQQQPECIHDADACHVGECKVWESSRFVCEPETYAVMVFPAKCLTKDEITPDTRLEMRINEKGEGDRSTAKIIGSRITFKPDCGHIEIRKRYANY